MKEKNEPVVEQEMTTEEKIHSISKPVAILQQEMENKIVNAINESGLHPVIVLAYLEKFTENFRSTAEQVREAEISRYNAEIQGITKN